MAERLDFSWVYDRAPGEIFRMVTRLEHLEEKAHHLGHANHTILELRERGGVFRSVARRQVDVNLPRWAPGFMAPRNLVTQTQLWHPPTWDGSRRYDAVVEIGGLPVTVVGEGTLTAAGWNGTRYDVGLDVRATRRMFGAKVERIVAAQLAATIEAEHAFRELWLNRSDFGRISQAV